MKKIYIAVITAAMAVSALFAGCTRDMISTFNGIALSAEEYNGGGDKAYISDQRYACWENNDQVKLYLNGTQYDGTISVTYPSGSPRAEAVAPGFKPVAPQIVYAGYPRALFTEGVDFSSSKNITLPGVYNYETSGGNQKITAPMVGKITLQSYNQGDPNPNVLKMYNLCTLLKIRLDAPTSGAFTVDSIVVVSTTSSAVLSGNATVSFTGENPSITMTSGYDRQTTGRVMLVFGSNAVAINATKYFYIPVPPLPSGQSLLVYAHNAVTGNWFKKVITTTAAVPGNNIATLPGPATNDPDAIYEFYNYLQNNGKCYIDLGVAPDNTSKMEMVFKLTQPTGSQYYSGSNNPDAHVTTFSIGGSTTAGTYGLYLSTYFAGSTVTSEGANASKSIIRGTANFYRVTTEVKGTPGNYYMETKFEELSDLNGSAPLKILTKNSAVNSYGIDLSNPDFSGWAEIPTINVFGYNADRLNPGMKLYSYRVWKNGQLTHNFVPAKRITDNAKGVLNMAVRPYVFIEGTGASGYSYTLGN